jgi:hypothetical protein
MQCGTVLSCVIASFFLHPVTHLDPAWIAIMGAVWLLVAFDMHHCHEVCTCHVHASCTPLCTPLARLLHASVTLLVALDMHDWLEVRTRELATWHVREMEICHGT